jgi:hypothetical protein
MTIKYSQQMLQFPLLSQFWFCGKVADKAGSGGRGTKWYPTGKGKEELKQKFEIEI